MMVPNSTLNPRANRRFIMELSERVCVGACSLIEAPYSVCAILLLRFLSKKHISQYRIRYLVDNCTFEVWPSYGEFVTDLLQKIQRCFHPHKKQKHEQLSRSCFCFL